MAASSCTFSEETESFVTCSICLCEFDGDVRKPKFLPCAHTLCLKCLKEIHREFVITCPLCRKEFSHQDDVSSLPNNSYAIHMLKLSEKSSESQSKPDLNGKPSWCLTCGAVAKQGCSVHSIIDMTGKTIKNFESLLKFRDDLKKTRDQGQTKLALAIEKRKEVQAHLNQISQCLSLVLHEVKQQEEQNNTILVEMISLLEANSPCLHRSLNPETSGGQDEDPLLSEMISLVNDSNREDCFDILKEKMKDSLQSYERKLADAVALSKTIQHQKKCRISLWLTDSKNQIIPTWDLLENGFNTYWPNDTGLTPTKRDFLILSHIVFTIQKRGMKHNKQNAADDNDDPLSDPKTFVGKKGEEKSPSVTSSLIGLNSPIEKFDLNKLTLIMTVRRHGIWKGSVHIKLFSSCNSQFILKLGKICFRSPKQFSNTIGKTVSDVFLFVPAFEDMADFFYDDLTSLPPARHYMEAGISLWMDEYGDLGGWNLVFPLTYFEDKRNEKHLKTLQPIYFIGTVTQGIETIETLSWTTKYQRSGYTFTLESR